MDEKYNIFKLSKIFQTRERTLQWLRDIQLIPYARYCATHKKYMSLQESELGCGKFVCQKKGNYKHIASVAQETWFERCHISATSCMLITYSFAMNFNFEQTIRECSIIDNQQISSETVADRFSFCREICMISLD